MTEIEQATESALRIYWIPNFPAKPFVKEVKSSEEAGMILRLLADYDLYLGDELITQNVGGLEVFRNGEWEDWENEEGEDIWARIEA